MKHEFTSILLLESLFPRRTRRIIEKFLIVVIAGLIAAAFFAGHFYQYLGGALLAAVLLSKCYLLDAFFYSTFLRLKAEHDKSFPLAYILWEGKGKNPVYDFATSRYGKIFLSRLGISPSELAVFFKANSIHDFKGADDARTVSQYFISLVASYSELDAFIKKHSVQSRHIEAVGEWIERVCDQAIESDRWWSKEHLARIPGVGKDWAYGQTFALEKHGIFISGAGATDFELYKKEIEELESVLVKSRSANAIIASDTDTIRLTIVRHLAALIGTGKAYPALEHKKVFMLDNQEALSEEELNKLFYEAERVGNIILVIDDTAILPMMIPYFRSSSVQCIVLASVEEYYQRLQSQAEITTHFELIKVNIKDQKSVLQVIEDQASRLENKYSVFFTYPAVESIVEATETYFQSENLLSKAADIAVEIAPYIKKQKKVFITKADVLEFIEMKTGIPAGEIKEIEKEKLLNLESLLHERVVGQEEAIAAISQAVRRARSGLGKSNRPIGSFLFLGPTGVGKTETAKALADIFFGPSIPMIRFDMSEYSSFDGLGRLIGDPASRTPGILANTVRERPYGLLLLDEFEKATKDVHNLFLQILDEGYFSDVQGRKVNLRNMIIIATSNAGSDLISAEVGEKFLEKKEEVITTLVSRGDFRPELINRFDGVIIFHALGDENLNKVTRLMLKDLSGRLKEKGIELAISDDLIAVLMEKGNDSKFGARPMSRAIADLVEEKIAEGLISGTIQPGSTVTFAKDGEGNLKIV